MKEEAHYDREYESFLEEAVLVLRRESQGGFGHGELGRGLPCRRSSVSNGLEWER